MAYGMKKPGQYIRSWINYFGISEYYRPVWTRMPGGVGLGERNHRLPVYTFFILSEIITNFKKLVNAKTVLAVDHLTALFLHYH